MSATTTYAPAGTEAERRRLEAVLDCLPVYTVLLTRDFQVPFANRYFRERFGEARGRRCYEYLFNRTTPCVVCETFRPFHTRESHRWHWIGPDGRDYDVHDHLFTDPDGTEMVLEMGVDVTERDRLERRLRHAQKMEAVGRLAGGVAHDFNNVLSAIVGYSELALGQLKPGDPIVGQLREVLQAADRAASLTRQLLAFSRQQVLSPRTVDLNDVLTRLAPMLQRLVGDDVNIALDPAPGTLAVTADPSQLEQIVMNLVVNARDAMPSGGSIDLVTRGERADESDRVLLTVRDTGIGMDEATRQRIFEPFFTTKGADHGTGLGLATVYGIVLQSGGEISVESEPGHGTTFRVSLPRATEPVVEGVAHVEPSPELQGNETVLVTEDHEAVRRITCITLSRAGYRVLEAANAGEALLIAEQHPEINLLLTDVVMPRVSGVDLAKRIAAIRPGVKVLFMSGYSDQSDRPPPPDASCFIQKPFTTARLLGKVRESLGRP